MTSQIKIGFTRDDGEPMTLDDLTDFVARAQSSGIPGTARLKVRLKGFSGRMGSIETDSPAPLEQPR